MTISIKMINITEKNEMKARIVTKKLKKKKIIVGKIQKKDTTKNTENLTDMREEEAERIPSTMIKKIGQKNTTVNTKIMINMIKNIEIEIKMIRNIEKVINLIKDIFKKKIMTNIRGKMKELLIMKNNVTNKEMNLIEIDQYQKADLDLIPHRKMKINKKQLWQQLRK